jgi:hypothetical protein
MVLLFSVFVEEISLARRMISSHPKIRQQWQESFKFCNTPCKYSEFAAILVNLSIRFRCFCTQPKGKIQNTIPSHPATTKNESQVVNSMNRVA